VIIHEQGKYDIIVTMTFHWMNFVFRQE